MPSETETTEADAWSKCPTPDACRRSCLDHPCLACWEDAGDIVAGLRLGDPIITAAAARIAAWPAWKRDSMRNQIAALGRSGENAD